MTDTYITLDCTIKGLTAKAVLLEYHDHTAWVPRSLLHGADDRVLDDGAVGQTRTVRMLDWKATQEGWV